MAQPQPQRNPFWQSARILLQYKPQLSLAAVGALLSAACFGAGLGMLIPIFKLLLADQQNLPQIVTTYLAPEGATAWRQNLADALLPYLPNDHFYGFVVVMLVIAVLSIIGSCGRYMHEYLVITVCNRAAMNWRKQLFERLVQAPLPELWARGTSDQVSRVMVDASMLGGGYQTILGRATADILKGVAALVLAMVINWQLTLAALVIAPLLAVLLRKFGKRIRRAASAALGERSKLLHALHETSSGMAVVKVHGAEGYERRRFARINRTLFQQEMKARQAKALSSPVIETLAQFMVMIIAGGAAFLIFRKGWDPAEFILVLAALAVAGASLRPLTNMSTQIRETEAAAARVLEALQTPMEPVNLDDRLKMPMLLRHQRDIVFDHVWVRYQGAARSAVDDVSLNVPFGQTIAIVGANGSGKTTLLNLIPRLLVAEKGRIMIDGVDLAQVNLRSLRQQIAVVTQQTILFQGTIAQNIAYGRRWVSKADIVAAAQAAFADEFITALPQGYDHLLGEGGSGLSGGQKQRLCIARAILRNPTILILDEATSQIDADSEAKITQALHQLRHGRTTFIIAHRLSTVVDADVIVVMEHGRVIAQGKHHELLDTCITYQNLVQTQLLPGASQ